MTSEKKLWVALIAVAILALGGYYYPTVKGSVETAFGGVTNYDEVDATALKIGGANGSRVGPIIATTCNAAIATLPLAASSTATATCAVTGVAAGDIVTVFIPGTTSFSAWGGLFVGGATPSTNTITFQYFNGSGAATSSFPLATTSVAVVVMHPLSSVPGL